MSAGSTTVLGFSFTGSVIPAGSGILTTLQVTGDACLGGLVLTGSEVVTLSEEQVKLISSIDDKLETLNYKVAIAFEVEKSNKETKNDDDFDPLHPPTEIA